MPKRLRDRVHRTRRFRPDGAQDGLEPRLLLTAALHVAAPQGHPHVQALKVRADHHAQRVPPTVEINAQFAQFGPTLPSPRPRTPMRSRVRAQVRPRYCPSDM
jgi:hypothetical protein